MKNGKKLSSYGVVGLTQGEIHIKNILDSGLVSRICICDNNLTKLQTVGDKFNIPTDARYTSFDEMLEKEDLDALSIATPNFLHASMAIKALDKGIHVLSEKPMAIDPKDAAEMCEAAERNNKILSINFNQRFHGAVRVAKDLFDKGELGEVYFVTTHWHRSRGVPWWYPLENADKSCGGGPLIDLGVHMLDRALYMCGYPKIVEVMGHSFLGVSEEAGKSRGINKFSVEDFGAAMLRTESGALYELEASWASNREGEYNETRIYGTKGGIVIRDFISDSSKSEYSFFIAGEDEVEKKALSDYFPNDNLNVNVAFTRSVMGESPIVCPAKEGLSACKIINAIYQSSVQKRTLVIEDR